ncbi:MAG TPA: aldo/keto reductase [Burkholderiaceae bacterium]|nr:aldo/keto reductase [Burkholderiaceae bacterium]
MIRRRTLIAAAGFLATLASLRAVAPTAAAAPPPARPAAAHRRPIPRSGELLPVIGLGTWITFDVGPVRRDRDERRRILAEFFARGGSAIDSSPMYGRAEEVLGDLLPGIAGSERLFAATKVWTPGRALGVRQMELSHTLWRVERFDLMQIHNLLDWRAHLPTLQRGREEGRFRYIGITTSHGRRHDEIEALMRSEPVDFVQLTYSLVDRRAEDRLLPLALDRGIAVIANRPFDGGGLFDVVRGRPLPPWAAEIDCENWAQYFLKFIVSHPAITCAIPATSRSEHLIQNMGAGFGRMPDPALRRRMQREFE